MAKFNWVVVEEQPYLYVARKCTMEPEDIGAAMGSAFQSVAAFMQKNNIEPTGPAISVYYTYDPEELSFRAGFIVDTGALQKASGDVSAATTPGGNVLAHTHIGPYSRLRDVYSEIKVFLEESQRKPGAPTWELYTNNPATTPEEELRTEIFMTVL